jgi:hypothetical protein
MRRDNDQFALTLFLAGLAAVGTTALRHNAQLYPLLVWLDWLLLAALLMGLHWWDTRQWEQGATKTAERPRLLLGLLPRTAWAIAGLACFPVIEQLIQRFFGMGDPWEVVALCCLQVASLGIGLLARTRAAAGTSVLLSSFQLLFVSFAYPVPLVMVLMALYTLTVLWWLMGNYWGRLQTQLASRTISQMPARARVLLPLVGGLSLVLLVVGLVAPQQALVVLNGFMPTTGGERWGDEFARGGVGNGEILTGAKDSADTVGPVDTDVYLSSQQPSLYDMISEVYGKPSTSNEKRIDVSGDELPEHGHERMIERAASREFKTQRQGRSKKVALEERSSTALLFVRGQVPLHLRMETFAEFDGLNWTNPTSGPGRNSPGNVSANPAESPFQLQFRDGTTWLSRRGDPSRPWFSGFRRHEMQVINLDSARIPAPAALTSWHVPLIDRIDFFGLTSDDVVCMSGRDRIPILTTISLISCQVNAWQLLQENCSGSQATEGAGLQLPSVHHQGWRSLAKDWTRDCRTDGERVLRIESRLRETFEFIDHVVLPENCESAVDQFLSTGAGPDYLFATTAAMLLRELGIPARLVTGLYADQRNYDAKSQQTIFWNDDVHTWVEFSLDGSSWLTLEPTPTYRLPPRDLTLWQWAALGLGRGLSWCLRNWHLLLGLVTASCLAWRFRGKLLDWSGQLSWLATRWMPVAWQVWWCSRWLDWRLWVCGLRRPETRSQRQWLGALGTGLRQETKLACEQLFRTLDSIRYDEGWKPEGADRLAVAAACQEIFRKAGPELAS